MADQTTTDRTMYPRINGTGPQDSRMVPEPINTPVPMDPVGLNLNQFTVRGTSGRSRETWSIENTNVCQSDKPLLTSEGNKLYMSGLEASTHACLMHRPERHFSFCWRLNRLHCRLCQCSTGPFQL